MTDANPAESPSRALILGTSPIAFELEQAYRRLGFVTRTGAASDADAVSYTHLTLPTKRIL